MNSVKPDTCCSSCKEILFSPNVVSSSDPDNIDSVGQHIMHFMGLYKVGHILHFMGLYKVGHTALHGTVQSRTHCTSWDCTK